MLSALGFVFLRNETKFGTDIFIKQWLVRRVVLIKGLRFRSMRAKILR